MASKDLIVDLSRFDVDQPLAGVEEIRQFNPQRFEMEQLTGILFVDRDSMSCVGYKDVGHDEFWCRGHMPGMPLMPGVIMLEAAAQLCSYFAQKYDLLGASMLGFGGVDEVRFRDPVIPGDKLLIMCQLLKVRRARMIVCRFQGVVRDRLVVDGMLRGIPLPVDAMGGALQSDREQQQST